MNDKMKKKSTFNSKPKHEPQTKGTFAKRLKSLSKKMIDLGCDMEYYGGFGEMGTHGRELMRAGLMVEDWSKTIVGKDLTVKKEDRSFGSKWHKRPATTSDLMNM